MAIGIDKSDLLVVLPVSPGGKDGPEPNSPRESPRNEFRDLLDRQLAQPPQDEPPMPEESQEAGPECRGAADCSQGRTLGQHDLSSVTAHSDGSSESSPAGERQGNDAQDAAHRLENRDAPADNQPLVGKGFPEAKTLKRGHAPDSHAAKKKTADGPPDISDDKSREKSPDAAHDSSKSDSIAAVIIPMDTAERLDGDPEQERIQGESAAAGSSLENRTPARIPRARLEVPAKNNLFNGQSFDVARPKEASKVTAEELSSQQGSDGDLNNVGAQHTAGMGAKSRRPLFVKDGAGGRATDIEEALFQKPDTPFQAAEWDYQELPAPFGDKKSGLKIDTMRSEAGRAHDPSPPHPTQEPVVTTDRATVKDAFQLGRDLSGEPPARNPVDGDIRSQLVHRVFHALRLARQRDGELRLRLHPPELGVLKIELRVERGVVTARLETESEMAKNLLLEHLPDLRQRLTEQRLKIDSLEVGLMMQSDSGGPGTGGHPAHNTQQRHAPAQTTHRDQESAQQETLFKPMRRPSGQFDVIV